MERQNYPEFKTDFVTLSVSDKCRDDKYTELLYLFTRLLCNGKIEDFKEHFAEDARLTMYKFKIIRGRDDIVEYWSDWKKRYIDTQMIDDLELRHTYYTNQTCLVIQGTMLLIIRVEDGVIKEMLTCAQYPDNENHYGLQLNILSLPLDYEKTRDCLSEMDGDTDFDVSNRMCCFSCGKPAEELEWYDIHASGKVGHASVCPNCKKIVEFSDLDNDDNASSDLDEKICDIEKGGKYDIGREDNGNAFGLFGLQFRKWLAQTVSSAESDTVNIDDNCLDQIRLRDGNHLEIHLANSENPTDRLGDESNICICEGGQIVSGDGEDDLLEILSYFEVEPNSMGAWQLYLLLTAKTVLPTFWHGGYIERNFIFCEDDIKAISPLKYFDTTALREANMLMPQVTISDDKVADVYCCYWNKWEGLVREHYGFHFAQNDVAGAEFNREVILPYDCGIFF